MEPISDASTENKEEIVKPTRKQWFIFFLSMLANMFSAMIYSLQAPFYPLEATNKGLSPSQYGFVFGVYELVVFISSPIFGWFMAPIGPKFAMTSGLFVASISCVLFGFLDKIASSSMFLAFSFIIRIVQGLGQSAYFIAVSTIIASHFPNSIAFTISSLETCYGLGLIIGPAVGGALYQLHGFYLPFIVVGGILVISALFSLWIPYEGGVEGEGYTSPLPMMKLPGVWLGAFAVLTTSTCSGYLQATLQTHLDQFGLKPIYLGLMFVVSGGVYAVVAPGWGFVCDRNFQPRYCLLIGALFKLVGFSMVGPLPGLPSSIKPTLWLCIVGLALSGVGSGGQLIPGFAETLRVSFLNGLPSSPSTYGMATGIWQSAYSIGAFIGPSLGGIIIEYTGFRNGTLFPLITNLILISLVILSFISDFCGKKKPDEEALISDSTEEQEERKRSLPTVEVERYPSDSKPIEYVGSPVLRPPLLYELASPAVGSWVQEEPKPAAQHRGTPYPGRTGTPRLPRLNLARVSISDSGRSRAISTTLW